MTTLVLMSAANYDLWYDATTVDAELCVETSISHGPRAFDPSFDPQPGDWVVVGDDDEPPCRARVSRRFGNRVWVQLDFALAADRFDGTAAETH